MRWPSTKKYGIISVLIIVSTSSFSQTEQEKGEIAKAVCECMDKKKELNLKDRKAVEMGLGLCMLEVIQEKKLDISISDSDAMEKFGQMVGIHMAGVCPNVFEAFMDNTQSESKAADEIEISGTVKSIDSKDMATISVRDDSGKEHKLLWLHYFTGSDDFVSDPKKMIGKKVSLSYKISDVYSPSRKAYVTVKELTRLTID